MNLRIQIEEKYKSSIKSKNNDAIDTLRLIKSAIKDKDIENRTADNKEIKILLDKFIKDNSLSSIKDMGTIMNYFKKNYPGKVDMTLAGKLAKELLSS